MPLGGSRPLHHKQKFGCRELSKTTSSCRDLAVEANTSAVGSKSGQLSVRTVGIMLPLSEVKRPLETRGRRGEEEKRRIALVLRSLILSFSYCLQNARCYAAGSFA